MKKIICLTAIGLFAIYTGCVETPETKEVQKKGGEKSVDTYKVSFQEVPNYLEATGSIQPDVEGSAKIMPPLAGTIDRIFVKVGDRVQKGDPLASIRSAEVADTYSNYLSNLSHLKQAERVYDLNKRLFEVGAVTKNDLLLSEANYEQVKATSQALLKKLEIYGIKDGGGGFVDTFLIKSPMDGVAMEIQGHIGDRMDSSGVIMIIGDPKRVMVVANIYDSEIAYIRRGEEVFFYTDTFPDVRFRGLISYISDSSDLDAKVVKTYIRVQKDQNLFRLGMFLKIKIIKGVERRAVIPKKALLFRDGCFEVYLKTAEKEVLKEVKPLIEVSDNMIAVEGLKEGDEIIQKAINKERT
jgi:cobalt-zinc-cadmium efflux system membrane fusion protein